MELIEVIQQVIEGTMDGYGLSDLAVGKVTGIDPLEVTIRESMAPLPQEVLWLTAAVIEKKIPVLGHEHITAGFRHNHTVSGLDHAHEVSGLGHTHTVEGGSTGEALGGSYGTGETLGGSYPTGDALIQDAYTSDKRLEDIVCYEDGKPIPVEDGFIILNRGLAVGDRVLLLRVMRGQQFVILSRIFERGESGGDAAAV